MTISYIKVMQSYVKATFYFSKSKPLEKVSQVGKNTWVPRKRRSTSIPTTSSNNTWLDSRGITVCIVHFSRYKVWRCALCTIEFCWIVNQYNTIFLAIFYVACQFLRNITSPICRWLLLPRRRALFSSVPSRWFNNGSAKEPQGYGVNTIIFLSPQSRIVSSGWALIWHMFHS